MGMNVYFLNICFSLSSRIVNFTNEFIGFWEFEAGSFLDPRVFHLLMNAQKKSAVAHIELMCTDEETLSEQELFIRRQAEIEPANDIAPLSTP